MATIVLEHAQRDKQEVRCRETLHQYQNTFTESTWRRERLEPFPVEPALAEDDLLGAGDLQSLTMHQRGDELTGLQQGLVLAGVDPREPTTHDLDARVALLQLETGEVRGLEFAARRWLQALREAHDLLVVEVQASDGVAQLRLL